MELNLETLRLSYGGHTPEEAADAYAAADDADARRVKLISLVERCDAMALELLQRLIDVTASNPAGE